MNKIPRKYYYTIGIAIIAILPMVSLYATHREHIKTDTSDILPIAYAMPILEEKDTSVILHQDATHETYVPIKGTPASWNAVAYQRDIPITVNITEQTYNNIIQHKCQHIRLTPTPHVTCTQ